MSQLIINADDFGLVDGVTNAIVDCHLSGVVTSTTLMTNMSGAEYALKRAFELPDLSVGVHLNLTLGRPLSPAKDVKDLIDGSGYFFSSKKQFRNLACRPYLFNQVKREFKAQIEWILDRGYMPSHIDSHHHVLRFFPATIAGGALCNAYKISAIRSNVPWVPGLNRQNFISQISRSVRSALHAGNTLMWATFFRLRHPNYKVFLPSYESLALDKVRYFRAFLKTLPEGVSELSVHPGYSGSWPNDSMKMAKIRYFEYQFFNDPSIAEIFKQSSVKLVSFKNINRNVIS